MLPGPQLFPPGYMGELEVPTPDRRNEYEIDEEITPTDNNNV